MPRYINNYYFSILIFKRLKKINIMILFWLHYYIIPHILLQYPIRSALLIWRAVAKFPLPNEKSATNGEGGLVLVRERSISCLKHLYSLYFFLGQLLGRVCLTPLESSFSAWAGSIKKLYVCKNPQELVIPKMEENSMEWMR